MSEVKEFAGDACRVCRYLGRSSLSDDLSAFHASAGSKVYHPIAIGYHVEVVLDDNHSGSKRDESLKNTEQHLCVERVQPDGGFIKDEYAVLLPSSHFGGEFQTLCLTAGKRGSGLTEGNVPQTDTIELLQT